MPPLKAQRDRGVREAAYTRRTTGIAEQSAFTRREVAACVPRTGEAPMKVPLPTQEQQRERQGTRESCRSGTAVGAGGDLPLSSDTMLGSWGL